MRLRRKSNDRALVGESPGSTLDPQLAAREMHVQCNPIGTRLLNLLRRHLPCPSHQEIADFGTMNDALLDTRLNTSHILASTVIFYGNFVVRPLTHGFSYRF